MRERPILFSAPMVRAILAGQKTQTRRVVKPQPELNPNYEPSRLDRYTTHPEYWWPSNAARSMVSIADMASLGPYGAPGDRLWVKETWRTSVACDGSRPSDLERPGGGYGWPVWYAADAGAVTWRGAHEGGPGFTSPGKTRVSIHMPRWASRIDLEVTGVRVERLQAITEEDALAEGARRFEDIPPSKMFPDSPHQNRWSMETPEDCGQCLGSPQSAFGNLWIKINGQESWDANPWVWVVAFKRLEAAARAA